MQKRLVVSCLVALLVLGAGALDHPRAATLRPVGFDAMVQQAAVIVQGRVSKLESFWGTGASLERKKGLKESTPPAQKPETTSLESTVAPAVPSVVETPIGVGTKGGRMIFTRVTLEIIAPIKGALSREVEFVVAGGALDGWNALIPGMPEFEVGRAYFLFLRQDYATTADPIVGVNQGFFQVVQDPASGQEVVVNTDWDYVLGIEEDRVVLRRNANAPGRGRHTLALPTTPPVPDSPDVQSQVSAEAARYWQSIEPPMTVNDLAVAVRTLMAP